MSDPKIRECAFVSLDRLRGTSLDLKVVRSYIAHQAVEDLRVAIVALAARRWEREADRD